MNIYYLILFLNFLKIIQAEKILKNDTLNMASKKLPSSCGRIRSNTILLKITGGREATQGEFPWMVGIFGLTGKLSCGGSLISNEFVLTAAHCFSIYSAQEVKKLKVVIGDHNIKSKSDGAHETRSIKKVIIHKGFNIKIYNHDIALLQLSSPVNFTEKIQPICLPNSNNDTYEGETGMVTGWGQISSGFFGVNPEILRKVEVPIWKLENCQKIYHRFAPGQVSERTICAGDGKKNRDACTGDSGGPLIIRANGISTQIGIVSWGKGCGSYPGVYTKVSSYFEWILNHI